MKNKDALKKHHFWILFGLVPLFVLIAVLVISSSVGGAISEKLAEIDREDKAIKSKTNPKSNALLQKMDESIKKINDKQDVLWKGNYIPQKDLYSMLDSPGWKAIEKLGLRFGDKIPNRWDEFEDFKKEEYYKTRFEQMAKSVAPTKFAGGWENVLRHVNYFTDVRLTSEQIWLMMEDIWVQESILDAIESVNLLMAEFKRVKFERDGQVVDDPADKAHQDPLRRKFKSRTWDVELEVVDVKNKKYLKCKLINTTDKLQLMGVGNTMVLKVWLQSDTKNTQPLLFKIGEEFLPGEGATKIVMGKPVPANVLYVPRSDDQLSDDQLIPPGMTVEEIARVEQVFDSRTVPIHLIQKVELGFRDSRNAAVALKQPKFFPEEAPAADGVPGPGGQPPGPGGVKPGSGNIPGPIVPGGPPGRGGKDAGAPQSSGGGTVASVIDGNKKRYLGDPSDQVRRMPIAVSIVVDQSYLQDVLVAFTNSPLRFQITQVDWVRFRGSLGLETEAGAGPMAKGNTRGGVSMSGSGQFGQGFDTMSKGPRPGSGRPRPGPGPGSGPGPGPVPAGPMSGPMSGFPGGSTGSMVSESQLTSGLIDLRVYGLVSLYTSPEAPAKTADSKDPKDKDKDPKDKDKDPKDKAPIDKGDKAPMGKGDKDLMDKGDKGAKDKGPMSKDPADPKTTTEPKSKM
jgi:hypothetical protein